MSDYSIRSNLNTLNEFSRTDNGVTRLAFSTEEQKGKKFMRTLFQNEGLAVREDEIGNMIARREGINPQAPAVAIGSHIDSVIEGGEYDGTIGVLSGLEVVKRLNKKQIVTTNPVEIIVFTCEESTRFGVSTIGSKVMTGLSKTEGLGNLKDFDGKTFAEVLEEVGLDITKISRAKRSSYDLKLFLEMHIEQGPLLQQLGKKIGVVTGIASPTRLQLRVQGKASHSGTTQMHNRKDALTGASEIALEVEKLGRSEANNDTVATTGVFGVGPGVMNVVPGSVEMKIDIRSTSPTSKQYVLEQVIKKIGQIKTERDLSIEWNLLSDEKPVHLSSEVITSLSRNCKELSIPYTAMSSGAGHDAMNMSYICPTGLIFVPSCDGISHHPDEYTEVEDMILGIDVLEKTMLEWAGVSGRPIPTGGEGCERSRG
ncbi:Zn-dependent hydrolase [Natribacillus halophilus]|uniref:N-carbamoyl-L-amino-acid hydrolase n=1 Tax=Natribacillus halophilus TaxID=549003 RepID=A0A1G8JXI9_9BACI|nr:Zn-dependent hydrolase [Natribacillus halophilus]SDI35894.1 N-carbamoyl-L-amino-acid hydrolase [Natribacillus halophilus]